MDVLLNIAWKIWISIGPIIFVLLLIFILLRPGDIGGNIWTLAKICLVFFIMTDLLSGGFLPGNVQNVSRTFLEYLAGIYDVHRNTDELLKIVEASPANGWASWALIFYTLSKYPVKLFCYYWFISAYGGKFKFFGRFLWCYLLLMMVCIIGSQGFDLKALIKNEGLITVLMILTLVLYEAWLKLFSKKEDKGSRKGFFIGYCVAFCIVLLLETVVWKITDAILFRCLLGT